jgi:hypothetical protein
MPCECYEKEVDRVMSPPREGSLAGEKLGPCEEIAVGNKVKGREASKARAWGDVSHGHAPYP